ncbi:MAG: hypothetical protein LC730_01810, partial [Acidobacteria bacterium]|nr:hypothetical protein [Acidobacteriota bacterium]
ARRFDQAEQLFRQAAARDPQGTTEEGRTAQVFLARTLHSQFIGNRDDRPKAEQAIEAYIASMPPSLAEYSAAKSAFDSDQNGTPEQKRLFAALTLVNTTASAIPSLYENLQMPDQARDWRIKLAADNSYPATARATASNTLAARANTCANDITDTEQTKKTVKKDGKDAFEFVKPENPDDLNRLRQCVDEGMRLIDQAIALEPDTVKNAKTLNVQSMTVDQLKLASEWMKPFESSRSYKASLTIQAMRLAEMEGRAQDRDRLKIEADQAKARFTELSQASRGIQAELETRQTAEREAVNANAAAANSR